MSELSALAQEAMRVLAPALPYLVAPTQEALKVVGERLGEALWEQAQALWERLRGRRQVTQVAEAAASVPDNPALQEALRLEIERALREDPELAQAVREVLQRAGAAASSTRSIHIGGDVSDSVIILGDRNQVQQRIQKGRA